MARAALRGDWTPARRRARLALALLALVGETAWVPAAHARGRAGQSEAREEGAGSDPVTRIRCGARQGRPGPRRVPSRARPTLPWLLVQAVPSPMLATSARALHFGLGWQMTPLLYSFAVRPEVDPFRFFIAEPFARQGGSVELFLGAELFPAPPREGASWILRGGARAYAPIVARGEYLSVSASVSAFTYADRLRFAYSAGAHVLFGVVGLELTIAPDDSDLAFIAALKLRYF